MLLNELIVKYREACSMSQSMFVDELSNITCGELSPSVGVLNGIEHGSSVTDELLSDYLNKRFFYLNKPKNIKIVDLSYKIASYCIDESIELDITRLLGSLTLFDVIDYLDNQIPNLNNLFFSDELSEMFGCFSKNIDVNPSQFLFDTIDMNDSAIFCYNLCLWFFLLSYNKEVEVPKEVYSDPKFVNIAELYGFNQFSKTSTKAKAKIARTISKRLSLQYHLEDLLDSCDYILCLKEAFDIGFIDYVMSDKNSKLENNYSFPFDRETLDALLNTTKNLISLDRPLEDNDLQEINSIVKVTNSIHLIFLTLFTFLQGLFVPSKTYFNKIVSQLDIKDDKLSSIIMNSVTEFNEIYDNKQSYKYDRLISIQIGLFKLLKNTTVMNKELDFYLNVE